MAQRDPIVTARNKRIKKMSQELKEMLNGVLIETGIEDIYSLNGRIGHKNEHFLDVRNAVVSTAEEYVLLWTQGLIDYVEKLPPLFRNRDNAYYDLYWMTKNHPKFREYLYLFIRRTYLRNYASYIKKRPSVDESEVWIGQKNAAYGLLITPRFNGDNWENDKSEIRHFSKKYWSIGHVMQTGLVIPFKNKKIEFDTIEKYLEFFTNVIVRNSGSPTEYKVAEMYSEFVVGHENPEDIPLLIPEFRYGGIKMLHEHRLDFMIIESQNLNKVGFELSPWETHGKLKGIGKLKPGEINKIAQANWQYEVDKLRKYFQKHGVYTVVYTDENLCDLEQVFEEMKNYLEPSMIGVQLRINAFDDILSSDL
jgi:hypothetical protein